MGLALLCAMPAGPSLAVTQVLVISGIGGEAEFDARFTQWSQKVATASATATGDPERVVRLAGDAAKREAVQAALQKAAGLREGDQFVLVLLGHGTYDGSEYRFNLPGPDLTGTELLALLDKIPSTVSQLVVNATSTSGAIADALASEEADRDKDGAVTAQEAYDYANRKVGDAFKADAAIVSEHARIGGSEPSRFIVARLGAAAQFASDAQLMAMRNEQAVLEQKLGELRAQKAQWTQDDYFNRIEPVLVDLARLGVRIDARLAVLGGNTGGVADAR
jgi:hypothetical protein